MQEHDDEFENDYIDQSNNDSFEEISMDNLDNSLIESAEEEDNEEIRNIYTIGNNEKSEIYVAGETLIIYKFPQHGIKLSSLHSTEIKKISEVFIPSVGYTRAEKKLRDHRFLIIHGKEHTGKYTNALHLSIDLAKKFDYQMHIVRFSEDAAFMDFLEEEDRPSNSIFLIHDAFIVPGLSCVEIQRHYSQLTDLLESSNSYAILTTDSGIIIKNEMPENHLIELGELKKQDLVKVLNNHLNYYSIPTKTKDFLKKIENQIALDLGFATNIDRFVQKLISTTNVDSTLINELIDGVTDAKKEFKLWFNSLHINERIYLLLASLCLDLDKDNLWVLYERVVSTLQTHNVKLRGPLNYSEEELWSKTCLRETELNSVEFIYPTFFEFALEQVHSSYRQQFRVLLPVFNKWVIEHEGHDSSTDRDARIAIARAIGEIGKNDWDLVTQIFNNWAASKNSTIRTSVAHALRQTASEISRRNDILQLLEIWGKNSHPNYRWTVAACCERLYPYLPTDVLDLLFTLSKDSNTYVRKAIIHAITSIARRDIDTVIEWINVGLINENEKRVITAANTFIKLTNENRDLIRLIQSKDERSRLLPIMENILAKYPDDIETIMNIFQYWISEESLGFSELIENIMLRVCKDGTLGIRQQINNQLSTWLNVNNKATFRFSSALQNLISQLPTPLELDFTNVLNIQERQSTSDFVIHNERKIFRIENNDNLSSND